MEFTPHEKAALVGILSAIVYADGFITPKEMDYMGRIGYELNIPKPIVDKGLEMEPADAFNAISSMNDTKKQLAGKILMKMAYADKELDPAEYELVVKILLRCGITPER